MITFEGNSKNTRPSGPNQPIHYQAEGIISGPVC